MAFATGKIMGGIGSVTSNGITVIACCSGKLLCALNASDNTTTTMTMCKMNEVALDLWSLLQASGSVANIGRGGVCKGGIRSFDKLPSIRCEFMNSLAESTTFCTPQLELSADIAPFEIDLGAFGT